MPSPYKINEHTSTKDQSIVLADLLIPGLPETLDIAGEGFVRKSEFHITLLAITKTARLIDAERTEPLQPRLIEEFYQFAESRPLTDYELSDDIRLVRVGTNKTIVVMAALKGIEKLFESLSAKHGVEIPAPPTHVTLYTLPSDTFGIGINSQAELAEITQPITVPEIAAALKN